MGINFFKKIIHIERNRKAFPFLFLKLPSSFWATLGTVSGIILSFYNYWLILLLIPLGLYLTKTTSFNLLSPFLFLYLGYGAYLYNNQSNFPEEIPEQVLIEGTITDKAFTDNSFWKHRTKLEVSKIKGQNGWVPVAFSLFVYSKKRIYARVQDTLECGPLIIKEPTNKDFLFYLKREGVSATAFPAELHYKIKKRPQFSILNWVFWQRELLQIKLRKKLSRQTFSLFSSLFIGNRKPINTTLSKHKQHFKKWGILHHLARSGLHLIVFIMIWHYLLNMVPLSFIAKQSFISFFILIYFLFSWSSLSFLRAFIVYAFYKVGALTQSKVHPLHAICSTCLIVLLYNPFHLFFLDFQLSFLLSFFLLWIAHVDHQRSISIYKSLAEKKGKPLP